MYQPNPYPHADAFMQGSSGASLGPGRIEVFAQQTEQVKRAPQIAESLKRMGACLDDLGSAMSALSARIDPVLRPSDVTAAGNGASAPAPVRCNVSQQIDNQADRLCMVTAALRDMLDRLEV